METWILLAWVSIQSPVGPPQIGSPMPILWDYSSKIECEQAAAEFVARGDEAYRTQALRSFEMYGYTSRDGQAFRCIRGPKK